MQFEKLLEESADAFNLLLQGAVCGPAEQAQLLREVLGLANAAGRGPRHILFGVSHDNNRLKFSKLSESDLKVLETYPDLIARFIEPPLSVEAIIGTAHGHLIAALSINYSEDPPYIIKMDASRDLRRGDCWVREGGVCRPSQRADFDRMYRKTAERRPATCKRIVQLGFGENPLQQSL